MLGFQFSRLTIAAAIVGLLLFTSSAEAGKRKARGACADGSCAVEVVQAAASPATPAVAAPAAAPPGPPAACPCGPNCPCARLAGVQASTAIAVEVDESPRRGPLRKLGAKIFRGGGGCCGK